MDKKKITIIVSVTVAAIVAIVLAFTLTSCTKSDGTAEVKFTIDTTKYDELVVFEELYYGKTLIGEHKDINDKAQTVSFSDTDTPPSRVPTGVSAMLIVLLAIMLIGGGAGIFFFKKRIR